VTGGEVEAEVDRGCAELRAVHTDHDLALVDRFVACHHDRRGGGVHEIRGDRAEQGSGQTCASGRTDHEQDRFLGNSGQHLGGMAVDDVRPHIGFRRHPRTLRHDHGQLAFCVLTRPLVGHRVGQRHGAGVDRQLGIRTADRAHHDELAPPVRGLLRGPQHRLTSVR
jgi:hypothetical protein